MRVLNTLLVLGSMVACSMPSKSVQNTLVRQKAVPSVNEQATQKITGTPVETGQPALHAIRSQQLEQVMAQINELVYGKIQNEVVLSRETWLRTKEIAKLAHDLSDTVLVMRDALPNLNLTSSEQITFSALANKLQTDAQQIEVAAKNEDISKIYDRVQQITTTCTSCHSLFRKSRTMLERCRDPKNTC